MIGAAGASLPPGELEMRNLRRSWSVAARLAVLGASFALAFGATAAPRAKSASGVAYAPQGSTGFVDLSEDGASGAGFYPLPRQYRTGALQERRRRPAQYAAGPGAIATAVESEAIPYDFDEGYAFGHGHGVFSPMDGVGTPFFGGYYQ